MENQISILNYSPYVDYEGVKQLYIGGGLYYEPFDSQERLRERSERDPNSIFVAVDSHKIVGTVSLTEDGRMAFIFRLAVDPEYRNRGIGKALMETAEEELFGRGYTEINIFVENKDIKLKQYYERQDYEQGNIYRWMTKERK